MKLYYAPAAASLAAHIIACEAGLPLDLIKVDLQSKRTEFGEDFYQINPNGYVPLLVIDDGHQLTETAVILQYLADLAPEKQLIPLSGEFSRYQVQQWLNFIASEIHKNLVALFKPTTAQAVKEAATITLNTRLATIAKQLTTQDYLVSGRFTVADAYLFIALNALQFLNFDISAWPVLAIYQAKIAARPAVQQAMREEGLM